MRNAAAILGLLLSGCIVHVDKDPDARTSSRPAPAPAPQPPPPPAPPAPSGAAQSESYMLKYRGKVDVVYAGIGKACDRLNFRITKSDTPGDDNWWVRGHHASGSFDLHIHMNRHDHKSRTTVTVTSGRYDQQSCREWTRRLHAEIGKQIGESGTD
ncbi:MAG TPA: hypothetical protein VF950_06415 [Planctomycetota bacterium]